MADFKDIFKTQSEIDNVYVKIDELFKLNIDKELKDVNYRFKLFYKVHDLVENDEFYIANIESASLTFLNRETLIEQLIEFFEQEIANIPNELKDLEDERRNSRYWDDNQHFIETEALSEKEGKLSKIKKKLMKYRKQS